MYHAIYRLLLQIKFDNYITLIKLDLTKVYALALISCQEYENLRFYYIIIITTTTTFVKWLYQRASSRSFFRLENRIGVKYARRRVLVPFPLARFTPTLSPLSPSSSRSVLSAVSRDF